MNPSGMTVQPQHLNNWTAGYVALLVASLLGIGLLNHVANK
jgi:hypothetical protein